MEPACDICGQPGDPDTLLCPACHIRLKQPWRRRIELAAIHAALMRQAFLEGEVMGGVRWTEQQYLEHVRRTQTPPPPEPKKASKRPPPKADPCALIFELPLVPTRSQWDRMHYRAKRRYMDQLAAEVAHQTPAASGIPFRRAKVEIIRQSSKQPDRDNLWGSAKPVLDVLQVKSKRHPYGTYVIENDDADHIELDCRWEKTSPKHGKTLVIVTPF